MFAFFPYLVAFVFIVPCVMSAPVLLEAESFRERGGWVVDSQFMDVMGSPFLLAHGLSHPVQPAVQRLRYRESGHTGFTCEHGIRLCRTVREDLQVP